MRSLAALLVSAALALAVLCGTTGAAVQHGMLGPPQFDVAAGNLRMIADVAFVPVCPQLINPGCTLDQPLPPIEIYTIWVLHRSGGPGWDGSDMRKIFSIRIERQGAP